MARADDPHIPTLIHPRPASTTLLPSHPSLRDSESKSINRPSLSHFVQTVLAEGHHLAMTINDDIFAAGKLRHVNDVSAAVQVYKRPMRRDHQPILMGDTIPRPEHWFGRQTEHENAREDGTVGYSEFKSFLKSGYVASKAKYIPNVTGETKLFEYDCSQLEFERFRDITASVHVLTQKNALTHPRIFLSLIVTACIPLGIDPLAPLQDIQDKNVPRRTPNPPKINYETNPPTVMYDEIGATTSAEDTLTDENEPGFLVIQIPLQRPGILDTSAILPRSVMVPLASVEFVRRMTGPDDGELKNGKLEWSVAMSAGGTMGAVPLKMMRGSVFAGTSARRMARDARRFVRWVGEERRTERFRESMAGKSQ